MHPILAHRGRLGLYLLAWVPTVPLAATLLVLDGHGWGEAFALAFPLLVVYAYLCLAAWYACRALPIRGGEVLTILVTHGLSALLSAGLWVLLGKGWAFLLERLALFPRAVADYALSVPYLFPSADAARLRWRAAAGAGVDWVATDDYAEIVAELGGARH